MTTRKTARSATDIIEGLPERKGARLRRLAEAGAVTRQLDAIALLVARS